MKAAILYGDREIRVGQAPDPQLKPEEVLVRAGFAGICGTDVHIYRGEFHERVAFPAILGHEFGGIVEELGSQVSGFQRGDRVTADPVISCHHCVACRSGHINACRSLKLLGVDLNGGFGQFVAVPASHLYRLPDQVPMQFAPMVEMYALGHHILARGEVQAGESVAILGAGKLGLSVLDVLCHKVNPGLTFITDLSPFRLETARRLGVDHAISVEEEDPTPRILEITEGAGVDCVIECVGHYHQIPGREAPLQQALRMIRNGGRIVACGLGEQWTPLHFKTMVIKEARLIASRVTCGEFPRALHQMSKGLLHPEALVTEKAAIDEVTSTFAKVDNDDPKTIKVVLDIQAV